MLFSIWSSIINDFSSNPYFTPANRFIIIAVIAHFFQRHRVSGGRFNKASKYVSYLAQPPVVRLIYKKWVAELGPLVLGGDQIWCVNVVRLWHWHVSIAMWLEFGSSRTIGVSSSITLQSFASLLSCRMCACFSRAVFLCWSCMSSGKQFNWTYYVMHGWGWIQTQMVDVALSVKNFGHKWFKIAVTSFWWLQNIAAWIV